MAENIEEKKTSYTKYNKKYYEKQKLRRQEHIKELKESGNYIETRGRPKLPPELKKKPQDYKKPKKEKQPKLPKEKNTTGKPRGRQPKYQTIEEYRKARNAQQKIRLGMLPEEKKQERKKKNHERYLKNKEKVIEEVKII